MSSVDQLFEDFAAAFRKSRDTDPRPFLEAAGDEREELSDLIEMFLIRVEPAVWDADAFEGSLAQRATNDLMPSLLAPEGGWRTLLPALRERAKLKRSQVNEELATRLRAKEWGEREKVADYYNDMEQGNLRPQGVSREVLEALGAIYGTTVDLLRKAGEATDPGRPGSGAKVVWARTHDDSIGDLAMDSPGLYASRIEGKPDRIDLLFTDPDHDEISG